jgi:RimJ/RimL family protein N-acetyltransferase
MHWVQAITLSSSVITLRPLTLDDEAGLIAAATDGELWRLRVTSVPEPKNTRQYIETALQAWRDGHRLAFAVTDSASGKVLGCTSYHDILPAVQRLEIGFTWYAASVQRTHVNTSCKLMMLTHAFESLGAKVVGWRTDNFNFASQRAIKRLGARLDGVIRGHALRRDGTVRDTVMYSMTAGEWPEAKAQLLSLQAR